MSGINRFLGIFIVSVVAVAVGGGCCCLDNCCTSIGVGDCTSYPGSEGCVGDYCGGGDDFACGGGCGGGGYDGLCGGGWCGGGWYGGWHAGLWDGCGAGCCGAWTPGCGPVLGLLRLVRQAIFCGVGCGGVYWGDWLGDPPACQDPCCFDYGYGDCTTCDSGGCAGDSCNSELSQRNYNWKRGSAACNGTCEAKGGHQAGRSRIASRRHPRGRVAKTAAKPSQFRAGDRVVNMATKY